ncbi:MAG: transcriptional regulator, partial [Pseudomonadota bacterium]
ALDTTIAFFFEGLDSEYQEAPGNPVADMPENLLADKEAMELIRSYYAIPETQRRRLFDLARVLSDVA